ncbi:MAG: T9SS type A sorting domain-containing protein [Bacteroidetes bacterium]|nr:T9SS type A sorting domain-containing protein [Bacteroidota bacterium]
MKKRIYTTLAILAVALIFTAAAGAQTISTFAGTGTNGYSGDGGPAINAELNQPIALARDANGNIYIGEGNGNVIRKVDPSGIITTFAGTGFHGYTGDGGPATAAELSGPDGLAFDSFGNMFITDFGNSVIRKVDLSGIITTIAGIGTAGYSGDGGPATAAQFNFPRDIHFDTDGNMYICDWLNYAIRKIDHSGIITTFAGTGVAGYTGDGGPATSAQIGLPYRSCFSPGGIFYFVDGTNNCIRKIDHAGIITTVVGNGSWGFSGDGGPASAALLNMPTAVLFDVDGKMYIADRGNDRIRNVNLAGIINTVAGIGVAGETGDGGLAINAEINKPFDLMFDASNNLYFPDINGEKVRRMTADPTLGTGNPAAAAGNFSIFPNPNPGAFRVTGSFTSSEGETATLTLMNGTGQTVYQKPVSLLNGKVDQMVNLTRDLPAGVYCLNLRSSSESYTCRVLIRK